MMGSMGTVVGEKITNLIELALENELPFEVSVFNSGNSNYW